MSTLEGYKTIIIALMQGLVIPYLAHHGYPMTVEEITQLEGTMFILLRLMTNTPVGGGSGVTNAQFTGYKEGVKLAAKQISDVLSSITKPKGD